MGEGTVTNNSPESDLRFIQDFGRYSLASIIPGILGVLVIVILTKTFSTEVYGRYSLTLAFVAVISTIATGWLAQAILRFEPELDENTFLRTSSLALLLSLLILLVAGIAGYYAFQGVLGEYRIFFIVGLLLIVPQSMFSVVYSTFQAGLDSDQASWLKIVRAGLRFVFGIGLAVVVLNDIVGWFVGAAVATLVSIVLVLRRSDIDPAWPQYNPATLKRMLSFGFPMIGWLLGFTLLTFIDRVLIELFVGTSAVGIYSSNYSLANKALPLVLAPVIQAAHPLVMNAWNGENGHEIQVMVKDMTRYFLLVGAPATAYLILFASPLSSLLLDTEFQAGYLVIPFVAVGVFVWNIAMIGHKGLEVMEKTTLLFGGVTFAVVMNVVLNIPLILQYGYLGAAIATLASFSSYVVFVYGVSRRYIPWKLPMTTLRNVTVATGSITAIVLISYALIGVNLWTVLLSLPPSGLVYVICLYTLGEIQHDEISAIQTLLQQVHKHD